MTTQNNQKYLLPVGFYDLLFAEAKINQQATNSIIESFHSFGYQLIKTPLLEFETSLRGELSDKSFRMSDTLSNQTLCVRSDITPQITRLLHTKFSEQNFPLRLCYVGDVLQIKNNNLYQDRQLTQAGIEMIGSDSEVADEEVINVVLSALNKIELSELLIDFCVPGLLAGLCAELSNQPDQLQKAIVEKNISAVKKLAPEFAESLTSLILGVIDFAELEKQLLKFPKNTQKNLQKIIKNLQEISGSIAKNYPQIELLFNVFDDVDFSYHQDFAFTIFAKNCSDPIAKGGKYWIKSDSAKNIPASGATIYVNNLRRILKKNPAKSEAKILVARGTSLMEIEELQKKSYITFCSLGQINKKDLLAEAFKTGCQFIYENKKISPVK